MRARANCLRRKPVDSGASPAIRLFTILFQTNDYLYVLLEDPWIDETTTQQDKRIYLPSISGQNVDAMDINVWQSAAAV